MPSESKHQDPDHASQQGPVMPGSVLYRMLQMVARAIAERLAREARHNDEERGNDQHD
jgi:hypothetical protein